MVFFLLGLFHDTAETARRKRQGRERKAPDRGEFRVQEGKAPAAPLIRS
jgi:hypothetical protein